MQDSRAPSSDQLRNWLRPVWTGRAIADESVFFVVGDDGVGAAPLLATPRGRVQLRSADGATEYVEGRDFRVDGRHLRLLPGTRIPARTVAELHPPPGAPNSIAASRDGKTHLYFGEGHFWHDQQCAASYRHRGDGALPVPASARRQLPRFAARIARREPVRLVALGDSITAGGNASGRTGARPWMPAWPELVAWALADRTKAGFELVNLAVGGMSSPWGLERAPACIDAKPDLMWIAFGMNDASGRRPAGEFADTVLRTVDAVRAKVPTCEFVLVAGMTGNSEWVHSAPELYDAYRDALARRVGDGIALADVTTVWKAVAARKSWLDLTGNGVNHPNDFGHRLYASTVLATLGCD
ncbi:MAG: SGNH/GDSL hydrolase family protein [Armatimonadota bacterium]